MTTPLSKPRAKRTYTQATVSAVTDSIPVPTSTMGTGGRRRKYPFGDMKAGESFFTNAKGIASAASYYAKRHSSDILKIKFTTSKVTEEGIAGMRVWRVS